MPIVILAQVAFSFPTFVAFPAHWRPVPLTLENGGAIIIVHEDDGGDGTEEAPPLILCGRSATSISLSMPTHLHRVGVPPLLAIDFDAPTTSISTIDELSKREE